MDPQHYKPSSLASDQMQQRVNTVVCKEERLFTTSGASLSLNCGRLCVCCLFFFFYVTTIPRRSTAGEEDWSPPPSSLGGRMETSVSIKKKSRGENNNGLLYAILFSFNSWLFGQKVSKCHREENTQLMDQSALPWPSLCRDPKSQHTNNAYA